MTNAKSTKKSLVASLIVLCLCFASLIGTTFAWFTDEVTSSGNIIKTGTLDVEMYWAKGAEDPAKAEWFDASAGAIFANDKWEPGYTEARHLKIENKGTLAFNYKLAIIPHGEVSELADVIEVYYSVDKGAMQINSRNDLDGLTYKGTLREFINNGIHTGTLEEDGVYSATVVFKMKETAGNEYMNLSIGSDFSIQLLATQVTSEKDSFDETYDANAFVTVDSIADLRTAIDSAVDTTTIFVQAGTYQVGSVIQIEGKSISIVGLGVVNFEMTGKDHMFRIQDCKNPASKMETTIKNINIDGKGISKHAFNVKYNVTANLENIIIKNTGWAGIILDNANPYDNKTFYNGVTTVVNLKNTHVEEVSMDTLPVVDSHVYSLENTDMNYPKAPADYKTYAYLNYDAESSVQRVEKQPQTSKDHTTMYVNGDNSDPMGFTFLVDSSEELKSVLDTVHGNSKYWNKDVCIKLAAGEYDGDYVINQYPEWNGERGHGNSNNPYNAGVPADAPVLKLTITGETVKTYARTTSEVPAAIFTGSVTVNGFGNSMTGFKTTQKNPAPITFEKVAFKGNYDGSEDFVGNSIVFKALNAADNLYFDGCYFVNATHVTLGSTTPDNIGFVEFDNCKFEEGGCLSGRFNGLTVKNCVVDVATKGFINQQKADATGAITIDNLTAKVGAYLVRTNGNNTINVSNSEITVYESEGTDSVIVSRGSGDDVNFVNCKKLDAASIISGVGASFSDVKNFYDESGVTYYDDIITGDTVLYLVPADYADDTVNVAEGVDVIGDFAFCKNNNVKTVVLSSTVRDLGRGFDSSTVEKVVLNEGLEVISSRAFKATANLKEVVIPSTVKTLADDAFQKTGLKTIVIPANVEYIGVQAFGASQVENVIIEGNVTINNKAFRGCPNLKTFTVNGENIEFINVNSGSGDCWICNSESNNKGTSHITFNVKNPVVKEKILTAMGADITTITINCEITVDEETGFWEDTEGNTCAYASDNTALDSAIKGGADTLYLPSGNYIIPDSAKGKTLTIVGSGDTVVASQDDGAAEGDCDYSFDGSTVTFENVTITTSTTYFPGYARMKGIYNNCTINGVYTLYDDSIFNNCTFNISGDFYNIWTWGASVATFNGCTFNTSGKAILLYGNTNTKLTVTDCVFNDANDYADVNNKAAIEVGSDWSGDTKTIIATNCTVNGFDVTSKGASTGTTLFGDKNDLFAKNRLTVTVDGYTFVSNGLYTNGKNSYGVSNAEGLATLNAKMKDGSAGTAAKIALLADIDFTGKTWTPVDSHADGKFYLTELDGNGHTIFNLTVNGQAMFTRFAGFGDVTIKNLTFDNANINSTALNTSILTVQSYQNVTLDNVDVKNSTITGSYKVAPLIATVYNESASTVTATLKNCDVSNTTVKGNLDFMITGMVAFVYESDNDKIVFENCTVTDVTLISNSKGYGAVANVYCNENEGYFDTVEGVTATNVTKK